MKTTETKSTEQTNTAMVDWAEWWEKWGNENFDEPAVLLDIEPL